MRKEVEKEQEGQNIMTATGILTHTDLRNPNHSVAHHRWYDPLFDFIQKISALPMEGTLWPIVLAVSAFVLVVLATWLLGIDTHVATGP